jgi:two-component system sensor histidine kinase HydH
MVTLSAFLEERQESNIKSFSSLVSQLSTAEDITAICLRTIDGRDLLRQSPNILLPDFDSTNSSEIFINQALKISYQPAGSDFVILRRSFKMADDKPVELTLWLSLQEIQRRIRQILGETLLLMAVTLSFGVFMSYFLAGFILNPLHKFIEAVKKVAEGDYSRQIHIHSNDEIEELAIMFNQMTEKLREKDEMEAHLHHQDKLATIGQISAGVAHEVRNPLVSIRSLTELLAEDLQSEREKKHMQVIIREVDRINAFMERLLNYAKPVTKDVQIIDLQSIAEDLLLLIRPQATRKNIRIGFHFKSRAKINACRDEMTQVILNLLLNAMDAMDKKEGQIVIGSREKNGIISFFFEDNGRGMSVDTKKHVFQPFVSGSSSGTGLGMSIVQTLVTGNGGEITVESAPGEGTTFTLHFPIATKEITPTSKGTTT